MARWISERLRERLAEWLTASHSGGNAPPRRAVTQRAPEQNRQIVRVIAGPDADGYYTGKLALVAPDRSASLHDDVLVYHPHATALGLNRYYLAVMVGERSTGNPPRVVFAALDGCCDPVGCCPELDCAPLCVRFRDLIFWHEAPSIGHWLVPELAVTVFAKFPANNTAYPAYQTTTARLAGVTSNGGPLDAATVQANIACQNNTLVLTWSLTATRYRFPGSPDNRSYAFGGTAQSGSCSLTPLRTPSPVPFVSGGGGGMGVVSGEYEITLSECGTATCYSASAECQLGGSPVWCCDNGAAWFCSPTATPALLQGAVTASVTPVIPVGTSATMERAGTTVGNDHGFAFLLRLAGGEPAGVTCDGRVWGLRGATTGFPNVSGIISGELPPQQVGEVGTIHSCSPLDFEVDLTGGGGSQWSQTYGVTIRLTE